MPPRFLPVVLSRPRRGIDPSMRPRTLLLFAIPSMLVGGLWIRSEFVTDLLMRRAPIVVNHNAIDLSRGVVSTRGCILLRRIVISPGRTTRAVWDWTTTGESQLAEIRTPGNRLGFGNSRV